MSTDSLQRQIDCIKAEIAGYETARAVMIEPECINATDEVIATLREVLATLEAVAETKTGGTK